MKEKFKLHIFSPPHALPIAAWSGCEWLWLWILENYRNCGTQPSQFWCRKGRKVVSKAVQRSDKRFWWSTLAAQELWKPIPTATCLACFSALRRLYSVELIDMTPWFGSLTSGRFLWSLEAAQVIKLITEKCPDLFFPGQSFWQKPCFWLSSHGPFNSSSSKRALSHDLKFTFISPTASQVITRFTVYYC